jgi:hypothetical protein
MTCEGKWKGGQREWREIRSGQTHTRRTTQQRAHHTLAQRWVSAGSIATEKISSQEVYREEMRGEKTMGRGEAEQGGEVGV